MEISKHGIIEFYAHAIPYLASTKNIDIYENEKDVIPVQFYNLNFSNTLKYKNKELSGMPRGPDS
ncbi:MAG: hypothetical protein K9L17_02315 [Clostridiales bacterium]|nr:hypothetical protein [Clostridiales bacterium]MCF8021519.1 hypothetical protein [Clostridiales bacterium]